MAKLLAIAVAAMIGAFTPAHAENAIAGHWINPRGTVVVTTGDCDGGLCGWVSWANATALADAADAGVSRLIGTKLLQDYHAKSPGHWAGRVYVPDLGRTFSSTIEQLDRDRVKISGCLIGGWLCKSQIWVRQVQAE
ncbi:MULTISPECIES: DUF2147 domain-containing protein [unclassified Sphingobium]|uniref:DUF2147 domain-containing protein n=1 Tax=unclassified Sphingobium TaxID=2611147 RepID=UPI002225238B|nr:MULTISPECIES: DUF2147 domain-containing protein [unclassified Sphingobium]MCW2394393.1 uncharacterized protein (DUF2147 family) [Sphingobium sp. B8D3B]MCW2412056.1 uncharacterized protein (DUF2147 family) [Sphingobium sp. B8D3D]MCW2415647.1 uncharacterized protein (DUF2147 family) [Sphingobium sp. B8D3A]MCW2417907.1 uncharacterized protein (DUF2147 family) [Sphingobium sp. B8D3C]